MVAASSPPDARPLRTGINTSSSFSGWSTGGQVALYFFPGGFTEEALITLTDDEQGERTLTLVVSSLTGEVDVVDEEPRVPDLVED